MNLLTWNFLAAINNKFPLSPDNPKIMLMRAKDGPFRCDNCRFYKGKGKPCPKQTALLNDGDCCNEFKPLFGQSLIFPK